MRGPLVGVDELAAELTAGRAIVLLDVRWTLNGPPGRPDFEAGHLPGAVYVDLETELTTHGECGGRHPLPEREVFQAAMRRAGVGEGSAVVVYDGATALAASRLWWLLTDAGHEDVRVLDGGYAAWRQAGRPVETGSGSQACPGGFVARPGHRRTWDADDVLRVVQAGEGPVLVDVRAADRYAGENETVDPVAGHIPGAISRPSTENLTAAGTFRTRAEVATRFAGLGEAPVLYCGSGITAAHTLLALESAGLSGSIYAGSWSDWITDPDRPRATGPRP